MISFHLLLISELFYKFFRDRLNIPQVNTAVHVSLPRVRRDTQKLVEGKLLNLEEENAKLTRMLSRLQTRVGTCETDLVNEKNCTATLKQLSLENDAIFKVISNFAYFIDILILNFYFLSKLFT